MNHLFVTQDYGPERGGMARRHVELCRRFSDSDNVMSVSTVSVEGAAAFDRGERYRIDRQSFHARVANRFTNQVRWTRGVVRMSRGYVDVLHCGNIRPAGYVVGWTAGRLEIPYIVYVNGGDVLRERQKALSSRLKRATARRILAGAAGIAATSRWVANLTSDVMQDVGVEHPPPVGAFDLGTDPEGFGPRFDSRVLRARWQVRDDPLLITVARLVPHKGQDIAIRALAVLVQEFPRLRYVLVGEGHDEQRLRKLAGELGLIDRVIFAGPITDSELPEAYATSTVYVGPSRIDNEINAEGFGISFLEASASGLPVVAGDSGGVRSAVRDGETGVIVAPTDVRALADAIAAFLRDEDRRLSFAAAGRLAVESHYNWERVARDTRNFTLDVTRARLPAA